VKGPAAPTMHYERTPRFRKVKLSWRCPRCDSRWLTLASKRAGLNHGSLTLGERKIDVGTNELPPRRQPTSRILGGCNLMDSRR